VQHLDEGSLCTKLVLVDLDALGQKSHQWHLAADCLGLQFLGEAGLFAAFGLEVDSEVVEVG
jgi:hypothetical protein